MSEAAELHGVRVTHPDKVLFDTQGLTKADLVSYYEAVEDRMMPHLAHRPVSLVRCPDGRGGECFFQRHASKGFPQEFGSVAVKESSGETEDYLTIDDFSGVVAAVQMGTLELHIWGCRKDNMDKPDRLVFDLDPDEGLAFADVKQAAEDVRGLLDALGLASFPMLTGGKGVHVVAPLERRQSWDDLKGFARGLAVRMAAEAPQRYVATMSKAKRKGRIFLDYLRNEKSGTAVAPYSTRSKEGAPVAAPVTWEELARTKAANAFTVKTMPKRLKSLNRDPWAGYGDVRQSITRDMVKRVTG